MKYIKDLFFKMRLKRTKEMFLHDAAYDLQYIEKFKSKELHTDTKELRTKLAEQNRLRNEGKEYDQNIINQCADEIAAAEAVQGEYEKLQTLSSELRDYLSIL